VILPEWIIPWRDEFGQNGPGSPYPIRRSYVLVHYFPARHHLRSNMRAPGASAVRGLLTCAERSLASFAGGHVISALLYLIPAELFLYALGEGVYLGGSFFTTVLR